MSLSFHQFVTCVFLFPSLSRPVSCYRLLTSSSLLPSPPPLVFLPIEVSVLQMMCNYFPFTLSDVLFVVIDSLLCLFHSFSCSVLSLVPSSSAFLLISIYFIWPCNSSHQTHLWFTNQNILISNQ
jgi:hypothetical protein